jgi:hypothetical protein
LDGYKRGLYWNLKEREIERVVYIWDFVNGSRGDILLSHMWLDKLDKASTTQCGGNFRHYLAYEASKSRPLKRKTVDSSVDRQ